MKSQINSKQKDKVASYAGGVLNKVNGGASSSSSQVNQKKKPYRARGCRGGASRKGRKKQPPINHSRQNEENDPSRLNTNGEERPHINEAPDEGSHLKIATISDKHDTDKQDIEPDNIKLISLTSPTKTRTISILTTGSELNAHQGSSDDITESNIEIDLEDPSLRPNDDSTSNTNCDQLPNLSVLPGALLDSTSIQSSTKRGAAEAPLSAIGRPASASSTGKSDRDGSSGGGFSFFCISPRSFLSGRKTKTQRLH